MGVSQDPSDRRVRQRTGLAHSHSIPASVGNGSGCDERIHILDLSEVGLRINSLGPFPDGEWLLGLHFPNESLNFKVRRIWQEELLGGFWVSGLEFAEPPVELLPVLRSHVTGMFEGVARRRSFRLPRVEEVAVGSPSANRWLSATSIDFSAEGVRIITDRYAAEGDLVPLRLSAGEDTLYALAEVAWIRHLSMRNLEMGLRLIEMGPRTAGLFRGLLEDDERP